MGDSSRIDCTSLTHGRLKTQFGFRRNLFSPELVIQFAVLEVQ